MLIDDEPTIGHLGPLPVSPQQARFLDDLDAHGISLDEAYRRWSDGEPILRDED